ncbi:MAG: ROK family protein [Ruminiclostridium sp.]|nr:ROK family protein [Ruminiclostridium sp.]
MVNFQKLKNTGKQTANLQLVKQTNLALIFNLIYKQGSVSRAELAQRTRLSPTTVSSLIEELLRKGVVIESGAGKTTTSGRKPIMIEINAVGCYIVTFEIIEDGFCCSLYDLLCRLIDEQKYGISDFEGLGRILTEAIEAILSKHGIQQNKLLGISIGVPGLINQEECRVYSSTVVPIRNDNDFCRQIKEKLKDIPVFLENESYFCAYAEKEFGIESDVKNLIFIDINIGIGAGIIMDGNMFRGTHGMAGEVGHVSIDMNGPKCKCGNRGCLETMSSIPAMVQKIVFAIMSGRETIIKGIIGNDLNKINLDVIKYAIDNKDGLAMDIMDEIAEKLAFGTNNVINLFNPQVVVFGGEIVKLGDVFLNSIKKHLSYIELKPNINLVGIRYSSLSSNAVNLGGAKYTLDNAFKTPGLLSRGTFQIL